MSVDLNNLFDFPEEIDIGKDTSIKTDGLEEMIAYTSSRTGVDPIICEIIVQHFFQEIRNAMIRGDIVSLKKLGYFYIKCRYNGTTIGPSVTPKFKPTNVLRKKIHEVE